MVEVLSWYPDPQSMRGRQMKDPTVFWHISPWPHSDSSSSSSHSSTSVFAALDHQLELHSVERIYLRQRCFDASKPRVAASTGAQYQYVGFSRRNKIPRCSAYAMGKSNPIPASGLWSGSGSKVDQFVYVPTPVDTQNVIEIHAPVFE